MYLKPHTKDYNKIRYFVCSVLFKSKCCSIFKYFYWLAWLSLFRSSHPVVFHRKCALKNFTKFTGKHMCRNLFFKTAGLQLKTLKKTLWPLFIMDGVQLPQGYSHFEEAVYFLPLSSQKFQVLIWSTSEGWKAESTLEPPSGFDHGTPGLGIQRLNH